MFSVLCLLFFLLSSSLLDFAVCGELRGGGGYVQCIVRASGRCALTFVRYLLARALSQRHWVKGREKYVKQVRRGLYRILAKAHYDNIPYAGSRKGDREDESAGKEDDSSDTDSTSSESDSSSSSSSSSEDLTSASDDDDDEDEEEEEGTESCSSASSGSCRSRRRPDGLTARVDGSADQLLLPTTPPARAEGATGGGVDHTMTERASWVTHATNARAARASQGATASRAADERTAGSSPERARGASKRRRAGSSKVQPPSNLPFTEEERFMGNNITLFFFFGAPFPPPLPTHTQRNTHARTPVEALCEIFKDTLAADPR